MTWIVIVVVAVGVGFFGGQIWHYLGTKREISKRCGEWVRRAQDGKMSAQTRESALADLERALAMSPSFGTLRRLGVIAPLLGVLLTASSVLLSSELSELMNGSQTARTAESSTGAATFRAIAPLFSGICVGAFLAILNQIFVTVAHREEDRLFYLASDATLECEFLRTDDRLAQIFSQIERGGKQLSDSSAVVESMLTAARAAMDGMNEACNAAATDLLAIPQGFRTAIDVPLKEFVGAAREMRIGAQDAAKEFGTGVKTLAKQAEVLQGQVTSSLSRQVAASTRQEEMAATLVASARAFEECLAPLRSSALADFQRQLEASAFAATGVATALKTIERRSASAGDSIEKSTEKLGSAVESMATTCVAVSEGSKDLSRSVRDAALGFAETAKLSVASADQVRSSGEAFASLANSMKADGSAISRSLQALSESIQRTAEEDARLTASLSSTTNELGETVVAIKGVRGALGQLDFQPVQTSANNLARSVQSLDGNCSAASESMQRQVAAMNAMLAQIDAASSRLRQELGGLDRARLAHGTSAMSERTEPQSQDNGRAH